MNRSNWITEVERANGVSFLIRHRRAAYLHLAGSFIVVLSILIAATSIFDGYATRHVGSPAADWSLGLLGITLIWGLVTLAFSPVLIVVYLLAKDWSEFFIGSDGIILLRKTKKSYPDRIPYRDISEIYAVSPKVQRTVIVTNQAGSGMGADLAGMANLVAQSSCRVAVNVRGSEIFLSLGLSSTEADYLFSRVKAASSRVWTQAASVTAPSPSSVPPIDLPVKVSTIVSWLWVPIVIFILYSPSWVGPMLSPQNTAHAKVSTQTAKNMKRVKELSSAISSGRRVTMAITSTAVVTDQGRVLCNVPKGRRLVVKDFAIIAPDIYAVKGYNADMCPGSAAQEPRDERHSRYYQANLPEIE